MPTHLRRAYQATLPAAPVADSIIRMPDVCARTGLSRATIYARIAAGQFPRPVQLGPRAVGWKTSLVDSWLAALPSGVTAEPAGPRRRRTAQIGEAA